MIDDYSNISWNNETNDGGQYGIYPIYNVQSNDYNNFVTKYQFLQLTRYNVQ